MSFFPILDPKVARLVAAMLGLLMVSLSSGCIPLVHHNPDYPAQAAQIRGEWDRLRATPVELERPIVVLGGWHAPPTMGAVLRNDICGLTSGSRRDFMAVSYPFATSIEPICDRVIGLVEKRWPSSVDGETVEVDVVAISMGGLVARAAAAGLGTHPRRLKIARLYTIGTPHRGARLADIIVTDKAARQMRRGSAFLERLDEAFETADYELVCYTHLNDKWVGATRSAPDGHPPVWTSGTLLFSHFTSVSDRRILVDLARRIRGEEPLARPSQPPRD